MSTDALELEQAFAEKPTLDTSIALCDLYLTQKRYMEAMVVCKKGMKTAPNDWRGRLMLAKIYLDQGKAPKACDELLWVLQKEPRHQVALEMMGQSLLQQGHKERAKSYFQQALAVNPTQEQIEPEIADSIHVPVDILEEPEFKEEPVKTNPILIVDDEYLHEMPVQALPQKTILQPETKHSFKLTFFLVVMSVLGIAAGIGWYLGRGGLH